MKKILIVKANTVCDKFFFNKLDNTLNQDNSFFGIILMEKDLPTKDFLSLANKLKKFTEKFNIKFIIHNQIHIAFDSNADGLYVNKDSISLRDARRIIRHDYGKFLIVEVDSVDFALLAQKNKADYIILSGVNKEEVPHLSTPVLEVCYE